MDRLALPGVDVVHDMDHIPFPFPENSFDEIHLIHVVEHAESVLDLMGEVYRISRPGARVRVITPHHSDAISWQDPTHRWHLNSYSFRYFEANFQTSYYSRARFELLDRHVALAGVWRYLGLEALVNLDRRFPTARFLRRLWEQHLCFVIRGKHMTFVLGALKEGPVGGGL